MHRCIIIIYDRGNNKEDDTVRIVLNVLPVSASSTVVIFSYHKEDAALGRAGLDRILRATGDYQKYELSKLIIRKLSNFYISPEWFAKWSQEKRERIKEEFLNTVYREHARNIHNEIGGASTSEHADFMIF